MKPYPQSCISLKINYDKRVYPIEDAKFAAEILERAGLVTIEHLPSPMFEQKNVIWLRDTRPLSREEIVQALLIGGINNDKKPFGYFFRHLRMVLNSIARRLGSRATKAD